MPTVIKAIMLGKVAVGKTSIILKCTRGLFDQHHKATIGIDFNSFEFQHHAQQYLMELWDTTGQERYRSVASNYYKNSQIVFLTVSALDGVQQNLNDISELLKHYFQHAHSQSIYVFVNKMDLAFKPLVESQWAKQSDTVAKMKKQLRIKKVLFVSAKNTNKEEFQGYLRQACFSHLQEDYNKDTVPSAISNGSVLISPGKKRRKKDDSPTKKKEKCC